MRSLVTVPLADLPQTEGRGAPEQMKALFLSVQKIGFIQPPVLTSEKEVVAGRRRIAVARMLGLEAVECLVCDDFDDVAVALQAEADENTCRVDWKPSEIAEHGKKVEAEAARLAKERQKASNAYREDRPAPAPAMRRQRTGAAVAEQFGVGETTYRHIKEIDAAAEAEPEKYGDLRGKMDAESVSAAHTELKKRKALAAAPPTKGQALKDAAGVEVPGHLRDLFGDKWLEEAAKDVTETIAALKRLRKTVSRKGAVYGLFLNCPEIMTSLDAAVVELENAKANVTAGQPHVVCPKCQGKTCEHCRKGGWLTRWREAELTREGVL